jgi:adenylate cyclase
MAGSTGSGVVLTRTLLLASKPADIWPLITDTDRTNRLLMGKGNVYKAIEAGSKTSARFVVETRAGGFALAYEEAPFEWTLNKSFSVYRRMRSGPLRSYTYGITLEPLADGGTNLAIRLELDPIYWILRPIVRFQAGRIIASMAKLAHAIDEHLQRKAPSPFVEPTSPANEERLAYAKRELESRQLDTSVVATLLELVRSAPDADLVRIRPFELAQEKKLDPRETLRACLHAVTLGILELRWALVCPSCRTANDQVASLSLVGDQSHCQLCDLSYGVELDRAVEATFVPHPSVRVVPNQMFCIGGPWRTPHVLVQAIVDPGETRTLAAPEEPGRYRLFARGGAVASIEVVDAAPAAEDGVHLMLDDVGLQPAEVTVARGKTLVIENATSDPLHVKVERLAYASLAATAHVVTTMNEFRRFFSRDLLKPSTPLKVASCAILFSDLTGSTALYTRAGDAAAFRLVDDHFDVLRDVIDGHEGVVVKTMGDAVMAAFVDPLHCVKAAIACLYAFERFRVDAENGDLTGIKLGLYAGPCYVVTANDAIDYFGQTVNCASRVQHCADRGEIVFEETVWERLPEADKKELRLIERVETRVKGVEHPLQLVRVKLAADVVSERTLQRQGQGSIASTSAAPVRRSARPSRA